MFRVRVGVLLPGVERRKSLARHRVDGCYVGAGHEPTDYHPDSLAVNDIQTGAAMIRLVFKRAAQTTILAAGASLGLMAAEVVDHAHAQGNLDASYTISFARIPVGEITATAVFGQSEYAISAHARAGGVMKVLSVDGDGLRVRPVYFRHA